jgi:branched-chain amino acid transport system ATP-binding protein
MTDNLIIETRGLTKEFNGFAAVSDVDLRVRRGQIHALIGPNGAGKTTCFNLLTKFLIPTRGRIFYQGDDITFAGAAEVARRGLVRSFQMSAVFPHLTVLENVRVGLQRNLGTTFQFWRHESSLAVLNPRAMQLLEAVDLGSFAGRVAVELPYGRKRALEIATTLAMEPELMLLDEPTQGMGHEDVEKVTALIKRASADRTVLMVEHNMNVVATIADTITVLQHGRHRSLYGYRGLRPPGCARMTAQMLRVSGLHAYYGESHILHGVDFNVNRGEVVTLLGRNGAGRTTTLKALLGLVGNRSGSVTINGHEAIALPSHRIAHLGVGYCPEERGIYASLSAEENLLLPPLVGPGGMSIDEIYGMFPNLKARRATQGTRLSGGEQQMLAMARTLRTGAKLLLLDEISEGLAPVIVQGLSRTIHALRKRGYTIVMAEQNFRFAAPLADRLYIMEHGRIVQAFAASELREKMTMVHQFLGV